MAIDTQRLRQVVRGALDEDVGRGDVTTEATVPASLQARGVLLAKEEIVLAGLDAAAMSFQLIDPVLTWEPRVKDGDLLPPSTVLAFVRGSARSLLTAERVALNFLQRLSGVATLTQKFVTAVAGTRVKIRDTRKTTPLLRFLEKRAVELGGGEAHRGGLDTALLVKDNHVRLAGSVGEATRRALAAAGGLPVEIEVDRADQIEDAIAAGAQMILLDNFTVEAVRAAVEQVNRRVPVEVSGGIKLETVRRYAEAGPDYIAVGALTHSAPAVDISLEIESD
ncbi:MAG TPA: carboxylating nicotinate-nucleotide diphosphorylase [Vicinamibacteria bacterium]|jgi:nicotinate-nucleotide pyrophosphorylase (carboxylating)